MSHHPKEPDAARLDGMTGTWSFLRGLLDEMPRYPRISLHPETIAAAAPKPPVEVQALTAPDLPVVELVVDLVLAPDGDDVAPTLVGVPGARSCEAAAAAPTPAPTPVRVRRGATPNALPMRHHRSRRAGSRPGRRLVA